jgi:hypothetical protein
MERIHFFIYLVIFVVAVFLVVKYWNTGRKD